MPSRILAAGAANAAPAARPLIACCFCKVPTPAEDLDTIDDTTPVCDPCLRALDADEEAIAEACDKLPPRAANDQGW